MDTITVSIKEKAGSFAENKDVARELRIKHIIPALKKNKTVIIDFSDVTGATQSFMHALISDTIRKFGEEVFDKLRFKNCSPLVKEVVTIVAEYMQEF
ncbi:STAS-like domain-containing protein [Candidatus Gottesmanbacteria bacterium]|nr:STAS-like domain-containing protein [Candidatus Gottesmanbacteria bacterium]